MAEGSGLSGERLVLRSLLALPGFRRLRLPRDLEAAYASHHDEIALRNLRAYWPLVALAVFVIAVYGLTSDIVAPGTAGLVLYGFGTLGCGVGLVVVATLVPPLQPYVGRIIPVAASLGLLAMHHGTLLTADLPELRSLAEYTVIFITIATCTIGNLRFVPAVAACIASLLGMLVLSAFSGLSPNWTLLPYYGLGPLILGAIIGSTGEIQERTVFLQQRLLALEKRELDLMTQELAMISRQDALTGLPNRRHFDEVLAREWAICARESAPLSLLFIDVDHFKRYNDLYGHRAGDECLARVGRALGQALRSSDFVARYGGEEFIGIVRRTQDAALEALASRVLQAVDELAIPHAGSEATPHVTVSVGVACMIPTGEVGPERLIQMADEALYRAKAAGRHRYETFSGSRSGAAIEDAVGLA